MLSGLAPSSTSPDEFVGSFTYAGQIGQNVVDWQLVNFEPAKYDVNNDGRLNALDVAGLANLIGTADSEVIQKFDFNRNASIDADDVDYLGSIVDAGLGDGFFGDANQNGQLDCCDRQAAINAWGSVIGSAQYKIELDVDLDGDNDAADQAAFAALQLPVDIDFNNDGSIFDTQDIDALLSVFSEGPCIPGTATCDSIDINCDGSLFDSADIDLFLEAFAEGANGFC